jgi:excisionase family DNA binding protein
MNTTSTHDGAAVYTVAEVADQLRCSGASVYRMIATGQLQAIRIGNSLRVSARTLAEFIARGES